jgi:hypothetical protein
MARRTGRFPQLADQGSRVNSLFLLIFGAGQQLPTAVLRQAPERHPDADLFRPSRDRVGEQPNTVDSIRMSNAVSDAARMRRILSLNR